MGARIALAIAGIVAMAWGSLVFRDYRSITTRITMFAKRHRLEAIPMPLGFFRFLGLGQIVFGLVFVLFAAFGHPHSGRPAS